MQQKVIKSDDQWKKILTDEQYRITRQKATEPAFTGKYYHHKESGTYRCVCCNNPLFKSDAKYNSGSGWPSYREPISPDSIRKIPDHSHGMVRTEVICAHCDAHLGHVFDDGPGPKGLRYCINSEALEFEKESK